jgi:hypothetical protein
MSVDTYLHLISLHRTDGEPEPTPSVAACSVALDRLSVDDPPASALLTIAAWLGRQPIPLSLLTRHADQLPAPLAQTARSPAQLADLAATLRRRGLAWVESNSVQLHRTPADLLLARTVDDRPDQSTWAAWAVRLLHAAMPAQLHDPDGWPMWRQLLPHVLTATDPTRHLDDVPIEVGWLLNQAASYLQARGEPRVARALFEDAYGLYRRQLGHDHPDTLAAARALVRDLHALGQHEQAHRLRHDAHLDEPWTDPVDDAVQLVDPLVQRSGQRSRQRG